MILVADTGPLIGLAKIRKIRLLETLASAVLIPPAVRRELLSHRGPEVSLLEEAIDDQFRVKPTGNPSEEVQDATSQLDTGERAAIALAYLIERYVVLVMDDQSGRQVARQLELSVTGLIGVLLRLKELGEIEEVTSHLEALRQRGYWLSDEIITTARRMAGELPDSE